MDLSRKVLVKDSQGLITQLIYPNSGKSNAEVVAVFSVKFAVVSSIQELILYCEVWDKIIL